MKQLHKFAFNAKMLQQLFTRFKSVLETILVASIASQDGINYVLSILTSLIQWVLTSVCSLHIETQLFKVRVSCILMVLIVTVHDIAVVRADLYIARVEILSL